MLLLIPGQILLTLLLAMQKGMNLEKKQYLHKKPTNLICKTRNCIKAAAILLSNLDPSQDPCENFYKFACGGFEARYLSLDKEIHVDTHLDNKMKPLLRKLLTLSNDEAEPKIIHKLRAFYRSCIDIASHPEKGLQNLKQLLEEYGGWPLLMGPSWNVTSFSWQDVTAKLVSEGLDISSILGVDLLDDFEQSVTENLRIIQLRSPFILSSNDTIRQAYWNLMKDVAIYLGAPQNLVHHEITEIMDFLESYTLIVRGIQNLTEEMQESSELFMNREALLTVAELYNITDEIDWLKYFRQIFPIPITSETSVFLRVEKNKLRSLVTFLMNTPTRVMANFIMWKVVFDLIDSINDPVLMKMKENYRETINNFKVSKERRWIFCLKEMSAFLTPALSALYGRYHFPQERKDHVMKLYKEIHSTIGNLINKVDWLDNSTVDILKLKLSTIRAYIAYPDDLLIDEVLENYYMNISISENDYLFNILHLKKFQHKIESEKTMLNKSTHWMQFDSLLYTNAFYYRFINAIIIPLSHLRGIYFAPNRPEALNFGSIGAIMGHELFHGVNEFGTVDYTHKLNWWTPTDVEALRNRAKCLEQQYDNFQLPSKKMLNGSQTLDENLSDISGLKVAYLAYQSWLEANGEEPALFGLSNFTGNQLFWLAFANAWCTSTNLIHTSLSEYQSHSPNHFRVIGAIQNMDEFSKDFGCPTGSAMNPLKKCLVW